MNPEQLERRAWVMFLLAAVIAVVLSGRLAFLQIVQGDKWEDLARGQRIRMVTTPAPRGQILDRNGVVLATNKPSFTAYLVYTGEPLSDATFNRLSQILKMDPEKIREAAAKLQPARGRPYEPVPLKPVSEEEQVLLEEHRAELPGVVVEVQPNREYPGLAEDFPAVGRTLASHVLGYVKKADRGPSAVGEYGIERSYNGDPAAADPAALGLQGKDGLRQVEVDAQGRPVRVLQRQDPVPGNNVVLTIDARVQAAAEAALLERMAYLRKLRSPECPNGCRAEYGAAVAIDVRTGEILALASVPGFDPNGFATRIYAQPGTDDYDRWQSDWEAWQKDPGKPLLNHATLDAAPPGSTFKPVSALAALEAGVTRPDERVSCPGVFVYNGLPFRDWHTHGSVNLEQALGRSCNVYFYQMALRMKIDDLTRMARALGLGGKTGLEARDGLGELAGWVAGPEAKKALMPQEPWFPSEKLSAVIGQAQNQYTPLQMAVMTAALANGGIRYRPFVVKRITSPDGRVIREFRREEAGRLDVSPENLEEVRKGMLAVNRFNPGWRGADSQWGTGSGVFGDFPARSREILGREIQVAGKTGTAEAAIRGEEPYGWYIAFGPYDEPEIAVAVMVRHGGGGSLAAAPVARAIFDEYFGLNRKPVDQEGPPVQRITGDVIA